MKWAGRAVTPMVKNGHSAGKPGVTVTIGPGLSSTECVLLDNCCSRSKRWISGGKWGVKVSLLFFHSSCASKVSGAPLMSCTGSRESVEVLYWSDRTGFGDICNVLWLAKPKAVIALTSYHGPHQNPFQPMLCKSEVSSSLLHKVTLWVHHWTRKKTLDFCITAQSCTPQPFLIQGYWQSLFSLSHSDVGNIHTEVKKCFFTKKPHVFYEMTVLSFSAARHIQKHPRVVIS